jgi:integrase
MCLRRRNSSPSNGTPCRLNREVGRLFLRSCAAPSSSACGLSYGCLACPRACSSEAAARQPDGTWTQRGARESRTVRGYSRMEAAKGNHWGHRDATMLLVAFRHGLRASELVDLRWDQIDFNTATLHVRRLKQGTPATHPIMGDELRALRRLDREQEPRSPFVFTSERAAPFTRAGFAKLVERAGEVAGPRVQGSRTHAASCLRLQARERRTRHAGATGLLGAQEHPAHRPLY